MAKVKTSDYVEKIYNTYKNDRKKLFSELKKLIKKGKESTDKDLIGAAYYYIALAAKATEEKDFMFTNSLKAVSFLEDTSDYLLLAKAYIILGYCYGIDENTQLEMPCYDKAYHIIKKHRIYGDARITVLNNLSACYHTMGECEKSIKILTECLNELKDKPEHDDYDVSDILMYTINLSNCYEDNGEPQRSRAVLEDAKEWADKVTFKSLVCDYYVKLAIISFKLNDGINGQKNADTAFDYIEKDVYPLPLYDDLRQLSHFLVEKEDKERAQKIVDAMFIYAENNPETISQLISYRAISEFYKKFGDHEYALECYERLEEIYAKRTKELKTVKINIYSRMKKVESEINRLNKKIKKSEELVSKEPLTKLLNRTALLKTAAEFIETAIKKKAKIGAIFIDIDHFKEFNDTYGHARGDEIIKEVARACQKEEKANVVFARYGGDEFFGITNGLDDTEVTDIAARICGRIKSENIVSEKNPYGIVTLSAGVVNVKVTENTDTIIEIINYADKAVYYAKRAGKNAIYYLQHDVNAKKEGKTEFIKIDF
ncbi:MAG: GGDEF domain-containing protein [Clostridia bacterium]|nr:GGDEF domain-containing protein [Clostridia bacterium]